MPATVTSKIHEMQSQINTLEIKINNLRVYQATIESNILRLEAREDALIEEAKELRMLIQRTNTTWNLCPPDNWGLTDFYQ